MYTRLLIPLDGSKTAEAVLPYGRTLARTLNIPVELLGVVDIEALATQYPAAALDTAALGFSRPSSPKVIEAVRTI
jgi:nucleotide-binding universal stress UspA family protein